MFRPPNNLILVTALLLIVPKGGISLASSEIVSFKAGAIRGTLSDGIVSFKGIPYARPPLNELRWRPPAPVDPWSGVRDATEFGPDCMQLPFAGDSARITGRVAEDCLFLNVWAPTLKKSDKLPVLMWVHGGAFVNGGSSPSIYDGSALARQGLIVVTFNYRLGRFGFFAHPALTLESSGEPVGNYGFMDQIAALNWVRENISNFGGDSENVTIFGESAGGLSVQVLLNSRFSQGLFHKAIIQSAPDQPKGSLNFPPLRAEAGAPSGESAGASFAKRMNIDKSNLPAAFALRQLSAEDVLSSLNMGNINESEFDYAGPMIDGQVVEKAFTQGVKDGDTANVPMIIGANNFDGTFAQDDPSSFYGEFGEKRELAEAIYNPSGTKDGKAVTLQGFGDAWILEPARWLSRTLACRGQPVYQYRFSYVAVASRRKELGATHASELPYLFGTVGERYGDDTKADDDSLSRTISSCWAQFAKTAHPCSEMISWPRYNEQDDFVLDFTVAGPVLHADPARFRLDLAAARRGR